MRPRFDRSRLCGTRCELFFCSGFYPQETGSYTADSYSQPFANAPIFPSAQSKPRDLVQTQINVDLDEAGHVETQSDGVLFVDSQLGTTHVTSETDLPDNSG